MQSISGISFRRNFCKQFCFIKNERQRQKFSSFWVILFIQIDLLKVLHMLFMLLLILSFVVVVVVIVAAIIYCKYSYCYCNLNLLVVARAVLFLAAMTLARGTFARLMVKCNHVLQFPGPRGSAIFDHARVGHAAVNCASITVPIFVDVVKLYFFT